MKYRKPIITDTELTYFPCSEAAAVGTRASMVMAALFIFVIVFELFDDGLSYETAIINTAIVIVLVVLSLVLLRNATLRISLTNKGIDYVNHRTKTDRHISWSDVSAVYFHQSGWNGRRSCKIYLKNTSEKSKKCDFTLPLYSIEFIDFWKYIPEELWKNQPKYVFF